MREGRGGGEGEGRKGGKGVSPITKYVHTEVDVMTIGLLTVTAARLHPDIPRRVFNIKTRLSTTNMI